MKRFPLIIVLATVAIIIGASFVFGGKSNKDNTSNSGGYEYFYSETCPHCANVKEFLDTWEGTASLNMQKKEISSNINAALMIKRAQACNINSKTVGVPFLVTPEGKCIVGDEPIIDHFKNLES